MRVLVVSKTTNLDLFGEKVRKQVSAGLLGEDHLIRLEAAHSDHVQTRSLLLEELARGGVDVTEVDRGKFWPPLDGFDLIITLGGDGTVLEASHHVLEEGYRLVGLRSSDASVGYLCVGGVEAIKPLVKQLCRNGLDGMGQPVCRMKAAISHKSTGGYIETDPILNDFLYSNLSPSATTRYGIKLNGQSEEHKSSGVWVSTAAGSTAAIGAAGGAAVDMGERRFQYLVRELYLPSGKAASKLTGGFFDPPAEALEIENRCDQAVLALDGQHGSVQLDFGDVLTFHRAPTLLLIR